MTFDVLEIIAAIFTLANVYLAKKRNIWTWPVGLIGTISYGLVFLKGSAYANASLQIFYLAQTVYGWYYWSHTMDNGEVVPIWDRKISSILLWVLSISILSIVIFFAEFLWLKVPYTIANYDSGTTAMSIVASVLLARKRLFNWLIWVVTDILYIIMFLYMGVGSAVSAVTYTALMIISFLSYHEWYGVWYTHYYRSSNETV